MVVAGDAAPRAVGVGRGGGAEAGVVPVSLLRVPPAVYRNRDARSRAYGSERRELLPCSGGCLLAERCSLLWENPAWLAYECHLAGGPS